MMELSEPVSSALKLFGTCQEISKELFDNVISYSLQCNNAFLRENNSTNGMFYCIYTFASEYLLLEEK